MVDQRREDHLPYGDGPGFAARVEKMLASGRISEDEAARVRAAVASGGDVDGAVGQIRLRHAQEWVAAAIGDGRMTQAEADDVLARLAGGEDPRTVRRGRHRRHGPA